MAMRKSLSVTGNKGFTLIEVLIALAILSIALIAVIKLALYSISTTAHVREKTGAHYVAMNIAALNELGLLKVNHGASRMLGLSYEWRLEKDSQLQEIIVTLSGNSGILAKLNSMPEDER